MKCVKCGKRLRSNEKFCTNCGYYNDEKENDTWKEPVQDEDLLEENWYDEEISTKEDEEVIIPKEKKTPKKKKETVKKEKKVKEKIIIEEEYTDENERYIKAYIKEDYKTIKKGIFNIWAFLLNWMYFLYRKLYITGIIGLVITSFVAFFFIKYFLVYFIIMIIVLGIGFNPYYKFIVKKRVEKILKEYEGSDSDSLEEICSEKGGVNTLFALIIYAVFLIITIIGVVGLRINTKHNSKFFNENSENKANCLSLTRLSYNQIKTTYDKVEEAVCIVSKGENKEYGLYFKVLKQNNTIYVYYQTDNSYIVYKNSTEKIKLLEAKEKDKVITVEESTLLSDLRMIKEDYKKGYNKSIEEDKLIEKGKDKEEKLNYIVSYEELIR